MAQFQMKPQLQLPSVEFKIVTDVECPCFYLSKTHELVLESKTSPGPHFG